MQPRVAILFRHWNSPELTAECLASLRRTRYGNKVFYLLDDAASGFHQVRAFQDSSDFFYFRSERRLEYCQAFNLLARNAIADGADFLFIVNSDTRDFSELFFEELLQSFDRDSRLGICGSAVDSFDGIHLHSEPVNRLWTTFPTPTEGYLVKSAAWVRVGGFRERLYRYTEDILLFRDLYSFGYTGATNPRVRFSHLGGGSSSKQLFVPEFYRIRNAIMLIRLSKRSVHQRAQMMAGWSSSHKKRIGSEWSQRRYLKSAARLISFLLGTAVGTLTPIRLISRDLDPLGG